MQYIILIGDEKLTLESIKPICHYGSVNSYDVDEKRYCVKYDTDHIFYDYDNVSESDYDESELDRIPFSIPHFVTMVYKSQERVKSILQQDNFLRGIYVDNDKDLIVPIEEFIKMGVPLP